MRIENSWRITTLGVLLTAVAAFIVIQMVRIQLSPQAEVFRDRGNAYSGGWQTIVPARGEIYDRWGHLLAGNTTVYEVGVELTRVENPATIALTLNAVVGSDYDEVFSAASQEPSGTAVYRVLADFVSEEQKARLDTLTREMEIAYANSEDENRPSMAGARYVAHLQRSYPETDLASNILGFVNREGKGFFGVEEKFSDLLSGTPKTVWVPVDPNRVEEIPDIPPGASLTLTIDRAIQTEVEDILENALQQNGAEAGTIVVMDPQSGEIYAMATTPRLDLNEYWRYGEIFVNPTPFNRAVSKSYESGSVFKVLTMAAALDSDTVKPSTPFLDTGVFEIGGAVIHNWNSGAWGPQDMVGCMQHSLNVCLAWVASQVGADTFYRYLQDFGIGRLTGIDLAGEVPGRVKIPGDSDWYEADLGTNSFGQGVSVTPIQMVMAVSAIANEGKMVTPRVVKSMHDKGREYNTSPQVAGMPISDETARTLTKMLANSLETESSVALVEGYRVAGKTGTAEIPTPLGYTSSATNASFVGWGPVDDPRFLVYVWMEKPTSSPWGSEVAAPVFRDVVERLVVLMNLPPDDVRQRWLNSQ
ncbi:MAG TPA: penicillin-binding protein 2 [Anaerolineales bacterium]